MQVPGHGLHAVAALALVPHGVVLVDHDQEQHPKPVDPVNEDRNSCAQQFIPQNWSSRLKTLNLTNA